MKRCLIQTILLLTSFAAQADAGVYFVSSSRGSDANSGTSWSESFATLTYAISSASDCDTLVVAVADIFLKVSQCRHNSPSIPSHQPTLFHFGLLRTPFISRIHRSPTTTT